MPPMKRLSISLVSFAIIFTLVCSAQAKLLTGSIEGLQAGQGSFFWGDGTHDLFQNWTVNNSNSSGWFYGSTFFDSNADVYVFPELMEPTTITDASVFSYFSSSSPTYPGPSGPTWAAWAEEGDTVFFRGINEHYGAWYLEDIYFDPTNPRGFSALNGTWYFLDDGSADFSVPIPEPLSILLFGTGLLSLARLPKKKT